MAISTIQITQGSGTAITVDTSSTGDMQIIKLAESTAGSTSLVPASASTGLLVNLGTVSAASIPVVNASATKLAVDGSSVTQPVSGTVTANAGTNLNTSALALETGGNLATIAGAVSGGKVQISAIPTGSNVIGAVTQSGTWNVGTLTSITNTVTISGTVTLSGTSAISGTVTGNQGTAAAVGGAWPVKLTDATNSLTMQNVSGTYALPVKVLAQAGGGYSQQDKTAFTEGTSFTEVIGGVYNDSFAGSPASGQASVLRITAFRAAHANLRDSSGNERGVASAPVITQNAPSGFTGGATQAIWRNHLAYTASQTAIALRTPASGKTAFVEYIVIQPTGAGAVTIFDNSNAAANVLFQGTLPAGFSPIIIQPARPIPLAAANNVLYYTTGSGATGDITVVGYDA